MVITKEEKAGKDKGSGDGDNSKSSGKDKGIDDGNEKPLRVVTLKKDNKNKRKLVISSSSTKGGRTLSQTDLNKYQMLEEKLSKALEQFKSLYPKPATEEEEGPPQPAADWDSPMVAELQELILQTLKDAYQTAMNNIVEDDYAETLAKWAVLNSGNCLGSKDIVSNITDAAMSLLRNRKGLGFDTLTLFESFESLAEYSMLEMVFVLREIKPFLTVAEAMWRLLIFDLNMFEAIAIDFDTRIQSCKEEESTRKCTCSASRLVQLKKENTKGIAAELAESINFGKLKITGKKSPETEGSFSVIAKTNIPASQAKAMQEKLNKGGGSTMTYSRKDMLRQQIKAEKKQGKKSALKGSSSTEENIETLAGNNYVPLSQKDETVMMLILRKQQMQKEMKEWTDWATKKVKQAAERLSKDQEELKTLRREREDLEKDETAEEEKTVKRILEIEGGLTKTGEEMRTASSNLVRLDGERRVLKNRLETAREVNSQASKNLKGAKMREQELLKMCEGLGAEKGFLQEDFMALQGEEANWDQKIQKARKRQGEFEDLRRHEEKEKNKLLAQAAALERERRQNVAQTEIQEANMKAMAERRMLKMKEQMEILTAEISALRLQSEASRIKAFQGAGYEGKPIPKLKSVGESSGKGGVKRERECVMCLTEEVSVVFLPCAHQVFCKNCNELHKQRGIRECPSCRAVIVVRFNAQYVPPRKP